MLINVYINAKCLLQILVPDFKHNTLKFEPVLEVTEKLFQYFKRTLLSILLNYLSCLRAYSSILILLTRSFFKFS